jgi:hypothetical protein
MISGTMLSGFLTASSMVASKLSRDVEATAFAAEVCRAFNLSSKEELQVRSAALYYIHTCSCIFATATGACA